MKFIMVLFLTLTLTACSRQPSEENIKQALKTEIQESNEKVRQMEQMFKSENKPKATSNNSTDDNENKSNDPFDKAFTQLGNAIENMGNAVGNMMGKVAQPAFDLMIYELVDVKKLGDCEVQKNPAKYKCTIKVTLKNKKGTQTNTTDAIFVKSESGEWVVLDENDKE